MEHTETILSHFQLEEQIIVLFREKKEKVLGDANYSQLREHSSVYFAPFLINPHSIFLKFKSKLDLQEGNLNVELLNFEPFPMTEAFFYVLLQEYFQKLR